ncbi:ribosomal-protein-serine acetyltransferase [Halobacillus alkaliphilus]|uniref:Ribosomal-protein-serine acetyltransferase n=1 Tax=Halobacillus alkaliphilus TaxID=396056 RepID=A0A1I2JSQ2_9BACI|nr:GNAT family protein [Halobacillus alkaliphilus]SFF57604.1 ribosomal-protein-serine acetyltransferase [Halobacillus alkaliphilus]
MFKHVINEHTELRLLEERHAEELFQLTDSSRESLRQWLPWIDATKTVENSREFIKGTLKQFCNNDGFQAGIWYKGELAGVAGLHTINWSNRSTSIGYWLGESFQGKGLMTQACQAIVDYCFQELDLKRIEIQAATGNEKSIAIPHRLGFKKEGCLEKSERLYGEYVDHYVFGLINDTHS